MYLGHHLEKRIYNKLTLCKQNYNLYIICKKETLKSTNVWKKARKCAKKCVDTITRGKYSTTTLAVHVWHCQRTPEQSFCPELASIDSTHWAGLRSLGTENNWEVKSMISSFLYILISRHPVIFGLRSLCYQALSFYVWKTPGWRAPDWYWRCQTCSIILYKVFLQSATPI